MSKEDQLEAEAEAADALALENQIRSDQKSAEERRAAKKLQSDRESKDASRKIEAAAESARQKRLSHAPVASPIPVPLSGDDYNRNGSRSKGSETKSNGTKS